MLLHTSCLQCSGPLSTRYGIPCCHTASAAINDLSTTSASLRSCYLLLLERLCQVICSVVSWLLVLKRALCLFLDLLYVLFYLKSLALDVHDTALRCPTMLSHCLNHFLLPNLLQLTSSLACVFSLFSISIFTVVASWVHAVPLLNQSVIRSSIWHLCIHSRVCSLLVS